MTGINYLKRVGAVYYARMRVPLDLIDLEGRKERNKSLNTKDHAEAKRRLPPVIAAWNRDFDDMRRQTVATDDDHADAVFRHYTDTLGRDDAGRAALPSQAEVDAAISVARTKLDNRDTDTPPTDLELLDAALDAMVLQDRRGGPDSVDAKARRVKLDQLRQHLTTGETALIDHEVTDYLTQHRLQTLPPARKVLAHNLMRAEIEALQRATERDQGDYGGTPRDPIVRPPKAPRNEQAAPGETISELFEIYASENPKRIKPDTLEQARRDIGMFEGYVGNGSTVHAIDKKAIREWKALLIKYPVRGTEIIAFRGMSMVQTIEHNEKVQKPVLTSRTVNRYLSSLAAFCNWLSNNGYIEHNPVQGMALPKGEEKPSIPFTTDEMNRFFRSPLFTGCQPTTTWSKMAQPGDLMIRDYRFWVPLIMAFSAARPGEIAQLLVADVWQEQGHWIMHITTEGGGGKSIKTKGSQRVIPIHPTLIKIGFVDYIESIRATGSVKLFPTAQRNPRGQMIGDYSREFGKYLNNIKLKSGKKLSLYSFRHGAIDAFRRAGHLDENFKFLLGHGGATMTGRYGQMPQGMLDLRVKLIESISYPSLNLSHLEDALI